MSSSHVLVLPLPAQGHVNPLMNFSQKLARHGFKISFVNTEFNHKRMMRSLSDSDNQIESAINFVTIPDGLESDDERNDMGKLFLAMSYTMPAMFEKLIKDITYDGKHGSISCIVADLNMGWALEVARKMGIRSAMFYPAAAAMFALHLSNPRLIKEGILGSDGLPIETKTFQLSPNMPLMDKKDMFWCNLGNPEYEKQFFIYLLRLIHTPNLTEWWFCNTVYELEPSAFSFIPKLLPIGPLLENSQHDNRSMGQFWEEDLSCLSWLDQQPTCSVIYVAFGSFTSFDLNQLKELAVGLDLSNRPFLWVIRPDDDKTKREEDLVQLTGNHGKIIRWAPQQKVLSHPSIACFISHCGWNSVMEGLCNGVPFLCWPYFCDQFFCRKYLCDELMVGLAFDLDEKGMVSHEEIMKKLEQLLNDENIKTRSLKLKEIIMNNVGEDGRSTKNFNMFVEWLKQ